MRVSLSFRAVCLAACVVVAVTTVSAARPPQSREATAGTLIDRFLEPDSMPLVRYRALRRLSASTRGGKMQGMIEAWTTLDPDTGFSYEIVSQEGSNIICRRVLIAALEAERKAVGSPDAGGAALTHANYEFLGITEDRDDLVRVDVRPRRKHVMLIDGSLFLNNDSADLVRVEGELSQRPSFWTKRVRIVREYMRVDGVHVPVAMRSTADVLLVGASQFSMTYQYAEINGRKVTAP